MIRTIGLRGGHSANCLGAIGLRNEYESMQGLFPYVKQALEKKGFIVIDCNSNANSQSGELSEGINKAKEAKVDLFMSLHMNSFNGQAHGTECWIKEGSSAYSIAKKINDNFVNLGFQRRGDGVKTSNGFYELNHHSNSIIVETCFCDSARDIEIWAKTSWEDLANCIANAVGDGPTPSKPVIKDTDNVFVVTEYLPTGYMGKNETSFKGIDMLYVNQYMCGVRWELRKNDYGQWAVTELLDPNTAKQVKESLGSWFCEYRLTNE